MHARVHQTYLELKCIVCSSYCNNKGKKYYSNNHDVVRFGPRMCTCTLHVHVHVYYMYCGILKSTIIMILFLCIMHVWIVAQNSHGVISEFSH